MLVGKRIDGRIDMKGKEKNITIETVGSMETTKVRVGRREEMEIELIHKEKKTQRQGEESILKAK